ncbi:MAG TPA: hypothetical protein P5044_08375 [bacterium]|nr:hypothetical protein [bacterium]
MLEKMFGKLYGEKKGIALFMSILMSMSLAVIALASMARLSETTHQTGKTLQERKLLLFADSAVNIASAEIFTAIKEDIAFAPNYYVHGPAGVADFKYYPRDITINPGSSGRPTLFGYRAHARFFAGNGVTPPGFPASLSVPSDGACYDITIDVREVIHLPNGDRKADAGSTTTENVFQYFLGKTKTVGSIVCFDRG